MGVIDRRRERHFPQEPEETMTQEIGGKRKKDVLKDIGKGGIGTRGEFQCVGITVIKNGWLAGTKVRRGTGRGAGYKERTFFSGFLFLLDDFYPQFKDQCLGFKMLLSVLRSGKLGPFRPNLNSAKHISGE